MQTPQTKLLTFTLRFIAAVQFVLGSAFLFLPEMTIRALDLETTPGWVNWLLGMMAARFLGFAFGMWIAARNPSTARSWIVAMIGVQIADWLVTLKYLTLGAVTLSQVTTAAFLPVVFVVILLIRFPRQSASVV